MTYHAHQEQWRTCPRCGQAVYKSAWVRHDQDCASIAARFGSAAEMVALFRREQALQVGDLARQLTGVNAAAVRHALIAQGVTPEEIAARRGDQPQSRRCRRCKVIFDMHGSRRGAADPSLCAWCDGTAPDARLEPEEGDLSPLDIWGYRTGVL